MKSVVVGLAALLLGVGSLVMGQGLLNTTAALALEAADVPPALLTGVLASYFLGWMAGCVGVPPLLRRVGHIRTFAALGGLACASALLHALVPPHLAWAVLRTASGFCMAGLLLTAENWLTLRAPPDARGRVLAAYLVVFHLALGGGQLLLLTTGAAAPRPFIAAAIFVALAAVPIAGTRTEAPAMPASEPMRLGRLVRAARTAMITALGSGVLIGSYQTLGPVYLRELGHDTQTIGAWMAAVVLGGLALQWPVGWLSDRWDRRLLTTLSCVGLAATCYALTRGPTGLIALLALGAAYGSLAALLYPLALAHGNDRVRPEESLELGTTLVLVAGVGSFLGPLLAGLAMARVGAQGLFGALGAVAGLLGLYSGMRSVRRSRPSPAQSEPFVPMPRTTAGAVQLDPRVDTEDILLLQEEDDAGSAGGPHGA